MKKIILSLGLLMGISAAASAQATFGLKAGGSLTNFSGSDVPSEAKYKFGFHAGVLANFAFSDALSLQPEVLFSQKGYKVDFSGVTGKLNMSYIDVPVLLQYNADGLFFEAGPQLGILASAKTSGGGADVDVKDAFNTVDLGYAVGLGYKLETGPMIGLRYNGGVTNAFKDDDGITTKAHNSAFQLYVGYMFGGK